MSILEPLLADDIPYVLAVEILRAELVGVFLDAAAADVLELHDEGDLSASIPFSSSPFRWNRSG